MKFILKFNEISAKDVPLVGGKNASLGEMFSKLSKKGINVPDGFALTTDAYWFFLKSGGIDRKLKEIFRKFNPRSIKSLQETGRETRKLILKSEFPENLKKEIIKAYRELSRKYCKNPDPRTKRGQGAKSAKIGKVSPRYGAGADVAVRSSGVVEDQPGASFAGQFESFLNVSGEEKLLEAIKKCLASAFNDRVISYREEKRFDHLKFALSVGIQKMVRSDLASSGIIFTLDTESGFKNIVLINSIYGVGEMIVKGKITPDEFYVFKPSLRQAQGKFRYNGRYKPIIIKNLGNKTKKYVYSPGGGLKELTVSQKDQLKFSLTDQDILTLAKWACQIEEHYGLPQDIEWAKDGKNGQLFIVQSRPETVHTQKEARIYEEYQLKTTKKPLLKGIAVGNKIGQGKIRVISDISKISQFQKGEILVTKMTDPDWVVIMSLAAGIVTDEGGKTCHAAIISRELGIPAIVGTKKGTQILKSGKTVTVDCSSGEGKIFEGKIPCRIKRYDLEKIPKLPVKIVVNIGAPEIAFKTSFLPVDGVGLARQEFIIAEKIRIHPLALYHFEKIKDGKLKKKIGEMTVEHKDKREYFVKELAEGMAQIAAAFWPRKVIVRLSDLKSNEYRALIGGELFEPDEANPMIGWRGASRYYDERFQPAFEMECRAIKRVREVFGLKNIWLMVPFCRTVEEGEKVLKLLEKNGLKKGKDGLKIIVMCEIPSNVISAEKFLDIFDGMSIGSNDLTQLVLGLDRDSAFLSRIGDERNKAVKEMISQVIKICRRKKKYCGICGDAPSSDPEFAKFLIDCGIPSISLSPDAVMKTILNLDRKKK